jgi:DNA polymerase-1
MGDSSDNYPGVTKVGEKTGLKLLQEFGSLENLYENVDSLKASKMKENLIADKEMAFLSQQLATINTKAPIEIGLDDTLLKGKKVDELSQFYDEMGFAQFKSKLLAEAGGEVTDEKVVDEIDFEIVTDGSISEKVNADDFFYLETLGENYHREQIVAFAWGNAEKIYVSKNIDLLTKMKFPENTYDFKKNRVLLSHLDIELPLVKFDAMLAKYLISTTEDNKISTIARLFNSGHLATDEEIFGKGTKIALPDDAVLFEHLARKIKVLALAKEKMMAELLENEQEHLLYDMELPLAEVLAKMEITGIAVRQNTLEEIGAENEEKLASLTREIYDLAGEEFNINSPKQLGVILFEKLQLPVGKKTKTGYSTAVDVLEDLAALSPVVAKILEYRQINKVQSTYVKGLIPQIADDGKIHTRYVQDLTQTGRLSSVDPNLQNIPVRLEEGRKIRKAFVPSKDSLLLSSDYSQIELRVLAHISGDEHLIDAFKHGADIHTSTAMRVFGIEKAEDVTANDRRNAKAVNFGVVYGISDFGLARNLGITRKDAKNYIETYFERYPGIKTYMENIVREARDKGFVETMSHRRRKIPDINARNFNVRGFAERTAINSPIQGSAADILKIAMINLDKALSARDFKSKLLLQVHDEIILDVPLEELDEIKALVKQTMEEAIELAVPLKVDENTGKTWYEAK